MQRLPTILFIIFLAHKPEMVEMKNFLDARSGQKTNILMEEQPFKNNLFFSFFPLLSATTYP